MKSSVIACLLLFASPVFAQEFTPAMTEQWEPVPPVITSGRMGAPPSDAVVLFDGSNLNAWESVRGGDAGWVVAEGSMTVSAGTGDIRTKQKFSDVQLHIEWRTPSSGDGEGQDRGNSGVYFHEIYEVQVLDSFGNTTYPNGQAGAVYKQHTPLVNASRGPGEWQMYDIVFMSPVFAEGGEVIRPASVTVFHNGVLIQNHVELSGPTLYIGIPKYAPHGPGSIKLQDHGHPVSYRNVWVREL